MFSLQYYVVITNKVNVNLDVGSGKLNKCSLFLSLSFRLFIDIVESGKRANRHFLHAKYTEKIL